MQAFLFKRKLQKLFEKYAIQRLSDDGDCMLMIVNHEGKLITAARYENEHAAYSTVQLLQTIFLMIDNNGKPKEPKKTAEQFLSAFLEEYKNIKAKHLADDESTAEDKLSEKEGNNEKN